MSKHVAFRRLQLTRCRINTASDAVAAVHHITGYFPSAGNVFVVPLRDHHPLGIMIIPPDRARQFPSEFSQLISEGKTDSAAVIGIGSPEQLAASVRWHADQITDRGIPVDHAVCATGDRLWKVNHRQRQEQAPSGTGYTDAIPYTRTETELDKCAHGLGSRPFSGIDEIARFLEPATGETAKQIQTAAAAASQIIDLLIASGQWLDGLGVAVLGELITHLRESRAAGRPLGVDQVAALCAMSEDPCTLDLSMALSRHTDIDPVLGMWSDFTRLAPPQRRSDAAALLAYAALAANDPTLAGLALDIAENSEPQSILIDQVKELLHAGQTPDCSADSFSNALAGLLQPAMTRFSLQDVLVLAEATLACSTFRELDGLLDPSPHLVLRRGLLISNGDDAEPPFVNPLETRDPNGRIPTVTMPLQVTDEFVAMLRGARMRGHRQLEVRLRGAHGVTIQPVTAAASQN